MPVAPECSCERYGRVRAGGAGVIWERLGTYVVDVVFVIFPHVTSTARAPHNEDQRIERPAQQHMGLTKLEIEGRRHGSLGNGLLSVDTSELFPVAKAECLLDIVGTYWHDHNGFLNFDL